MDDRHSAIAHRHHLGKAARFKGRRHQIEVSAGKDLGCHLLCILVGETELSRIFIDTLIEVIGIFLVALAKDDQLHALLHHLIQQILDQLNALLFNQSCDHGKEWPVLFLADAEDILYVFLADLLA